MAEGARLQSRVCVDASEDRATGVARPQHHSFKPRPLGFTRSVVPGLVALKYPAAFLASISTWASAGISSSGIATCSTISMPCAQRLGSQVAHRGEAIDARDAQPMEK